MSTSTVERRQALVQAVSVTDDTITLELSDGRSISAPLAWYPRLLYATPDERGHWRLIGAGEGVHWADLDEDIDVESVLAGRPSGESQKSFQRWLATRAGARSI